jgi:hypothetical protein
MSKLNELINKKNKLESKIQYIKELQYTEDQLNTISTNNEYIMVLKEYIQNSKNKPFPKHNKNLREQEKQLCKHFAMALAETEGLEKKLAKLDFNNQMAQIFSKNHHPFYNKEYIKYARQNNFTDYSRINDLMRKQFVERRKNNQLTHLYIQGSAALLTFLSVLATNYFLLLPTLIALTGFSGGIVIAISLIAALIAYALTEQLLHKIDRKVEENRIDNINNNPEYKAKILNGIESKNIELQDDEKKQGGFINYANHSNFFSSSRSSNNLLKVVHDKNEINRYLSANKNYGKRLHKDLILACTM